MRLRLRPADSARDKSPERLSIAPAFLKSGAIPASHSDSPVRATGGVKGLTANLVSSSWREDIHAPYADRRTATCCGLNLDQMRIIRSA